MAEQPTKRLGELLKDKGLLSEHQIKVAIEQQKITGDLLGIIFIKLGFVSSAEVAQALSEQAGIPYLNLYEHAIGEEALRLVPKDVAERVGFMPIALKDGRLTIGITNPSNVMAVDTATQLTKSAPDVFVIDSDAFYDLLDRAYYFLANPVLAKIQGLITAMKEGVTSQAVASLTELIVMDAIRRNATDLHITPEKEAVHVFYRIDGVLQHGHCYHKGAQSGVISKIKVMAQLDIA
ncbi:MAG TPA: ATPase, T2SS/T4P/T4SS family, partial [Geobacterales bacterium]|nr:ATPase, T2SS/T4P/T4SS family [Geobacterales bacterium]